MQRVFIPIEGTPFIHPSDGDQAIVKIPLRVPLPSELSSGISDSKFTKEHPSRLFHRIKILHGLHHYSYVYAEELLNVPEVSRWEESE